MIGIFVVPPDAESPSMLVDKVGTPFCVASRWRRPGFDEKLDSLSTQNRQQTKTEHPAELAYAPILFPSSSAFRSPDCKPNLITCRCPIDALEKEFKREAEFQFANDDDR